MYAVNRDHREKVGQHGQPSTLLAAGEKGPRPCGARPKQQKGRPWADKGCEVRPSARHLTDCGPPLKRPAAFGRPLDGVFLMDAAETTIPGGPGFPQTKAQRHCDWRKQSWELDRAKGSFFLSTGRRRKSLKPNLLNNSKMTEETFAPIAGGRVAFPAPRLVHGKTRLWEMSEACGENGRGCQAFCKPLDQRHSDGGERQISAAQPPALLQEQLERGIIRVV